MTLIVLSNRCSVFTGISSGNTAVYKYRPGRDNADKIYNIHNY